jgi:hypothetical protein
MRPVSIHTAWWRYPGSEPDSNFNFRHLKRFAQTLERVLNHAGEFLKVRGPLTSRVPFKDGLS